MEGRSRAQGGVISKPPRLYLATPALADPAAFVRQLESALSAGDVAAVLLRLEDADERSLINRIKSIAQPVQGHDAALLLDGRPDLVARSGADGAHLRGIEALRTALPTLKPDWIAGVGDLRSRHDAMLAGEANADYVMFGEPDRRDSRPQFGVIEERLTWWAEIFQPPCIGYAANADEIRPLAQAGADFVALGDWIWTQPGGGKAAIAAAAQILATAA
jgi:thiamine-phosphate pyrophosphorylase